MRSTTEFRGVRVIGGRSGNKRIGKILRAVFSPEGSILVGYIVGRPDFLFMFKRKDRFLAHDAFKVVDGRVVATTDRDSWDEPACKRLGIDWDRCLILEGMRVVTEDGEKVGTIASVEYDERTGKTASLQVGEGMASKAIVGVSHIPPELIVGYRNGQIVARRAASEIHAEGGLAAKAGEQAAVVTNVVKEKTKTARNTAKTIGKNTGKIAGNALDSGSKALGTQLGKTKGMFKAFKNEYKKESSKD
ncbi:MAG: PRC-barrel domain-containing protein [Coriobacteriia bacterium]|nr:PRC-barrel domain-containing protein [Coriobacteriia bacterium]